MTDADTHASSSISRRTRSANQSLTLLDGPVPKEPSDIEDVIGAGKRKRSVPRRPRKPSPVITPPSYAPHAKTRSARQSIKKPDPGLVQAPPNWAEVYAVVKEMRTTGAARDAPVDTMGCERIAQAGVSPRDRRYHTLTALMLSSQTKDAVNAAAMHRLYTKLPAHKEGAAAGLTLENILAVDPLLLNELIWAVGFHNNKTKYIKAAAEILRDQWASDIPDTVEGLISLPGVGPKMAYLCLSSAWGRTEGIGVDVHVHRITNLWAWQRTKTPEDTRLALQAWLPRELWHEINWLLVGLGQKICLPVGRKCGECELSVRGLCPAVVEGKVTKKMKRVKEEPLDAHVQEGDVAEIVKHEHIHIKVETEET